MIARRVDTREHEAGDAATPGPWVSRWGARDPLVLVVAVVGLVTYALHGLHGALTRDLALYSYAGQQVADGVPPYMGVLNRAGPLAHAIPAVGVWVARAGGFDDVMSMRVLFLLLATASTAAVYVLGRDLLGSRLAGIVASAVFLGFHGFIQYASDGPREKTPMTLFLVLALWSVTRRRWFLSGVFVSLATLCLQTAFFPACAAAVVGALLLVPGARMKAKALAFIAAGGAVPVAALVVWFAAAGSLKESLDAFLLINARYTVPNPPMEDLTGTLEGAANAYGALWAWLIIGGLALLALGALASSVRPVRHRQPSVVLLIALAAGAAAALWWDLKDYDSWADLFSLLPFAAVGVASVVPLLERLLPGKVLQPLGALLAAGAVAAAIQWSVTNRDDVLDDQRRAVDTVFGLLPPDATVTSVEAPGPLVLSGRTNPTRHQMFRSGLQGYLDDTWPGGLDAFARDLVDRHPTLVAVGDTTYDYWRAAIRPAYTCVGAAPGWSWWADRSLGGYTIAALRQATGFTSPADCARTDALTSMP